MCVCVCLRAYKSASATLCRIFILFHCTLVKWNGFVWWWCHCYCCCAALLNMCENGQTQNEFPRSSNYLFDRRPSSDRNIVARVHMHFFRAFSDGSHQGSHSQTHKHTVHTIIHSSRNIRGFFSSFLWLVLKFGCNFTFGFSFPSSTLASSSSPSWSCVYFVVSHVKNRNQKLFQAVRV